MPHAPAGTPTLKWQGLVRLRNSSLLRGSRERELLSKVHVYGNLTFFHLHYNVVERGCEGIWGKKSKIAWTSTLENIVMQMRKATCEKGNCTFYCTQCAYTQVHYIACYRRSDGGA